MVTGDQQELVHRYADVEAYARAARVRFTDRLADGDLAPPYPNAHCGVCPWRETCTAQWVAEDHLSRVAFLRRDHAGALVQAGIGTLTALARHTPDQLPEVIGRISDPMSGFFAIRTSVLRDVAPDLAGIGFKILLDIMTAAPRPLAFVELPYVFRCRSEGESKLDHVVAMEYLIALYDRMFGRFVPVRFAMFSCIGVLGVGVHMGVLGVAMLFGAAFLGAQILGALAAMTFNFALNNALTYRDRRLKGVRLWRGLALFMVVCGIGAAANVGVANLLVEQSGWTVAGTAGALLSVVWNYAVSSTLVWPARR